MKGFMYCNYVVELSNCDVNKVEKIVKKLMDAGIRIRRGLYTISIDNINRYSEEAKELVEANFHEIEQYDFG